MFLRDLPQMAQCLNENEKVMSDHEIFEVTVPIPPISCLLSIILWHSKEITKLTNLNILLIQFNRIATEF